MSIVVETEASRGGGASQKPAPSPVLDSSSTPGWQARRHQLIALLVVLAVVAALVANNFFARQYTPEGAVRQYLSALQLGDSNSAWSAIQVASLAAPVAASLTDQAALQAALSAGRPDLQSFAITSIWSVDSTTSMVDFSYETRSGTKSAQSVVQRSGRNQFGLYPVWHVSVEPTLLQVTLPKGVGGIRVDGQAVALPDGKSIIAVLPLGHRIVFQGSAMVAPSTASVDAFSSRALSVTYQPELTAVGLEKAKAAVMTAFAACAQQTVSEAPAGSGCPQSAGLPQSTSGQWQLVGEPSQVLMAVFDPDMTVVAYGHYQMVFAWQDHGIQHFPVASSYAVSLSPTATDIQVDSIQNSDGAPVLQRPAAASDQAAKDLVAEAFAQCAAATSDYTADCPQYLADSGVTNARWVLRGDPLAGATVAFDSTSGLFTVHGDFDMSAAYLWFGSYPRTRQSFYTAYNAYLLWDGQALRLVTIQGATS
jgi:hypothetical protein